MNKNHQWDEQAIINIIHKDTEHTKQIDLISYSIYETSYLIVKNHSKSLKSTRNQTNVVYKFIYPFWSVSRPTPKKKKKNTTTYIGHTTTILSRRLTSHLSDTEAICISHKERYESNYSPACFRLLVVHTEIFCLRMVTDQGEGKLWIQTC